MMEWETRDWKGNDLWTEMEIKKKKMYKHWKEGLESEIFICRWKYIKFKCWSIKAIRESELKFMEGKFGGGWFLWRVSKLNFGRKLRQGLGMGRWLLVFGTRGGWGVKRALLAWFTSCP
jgi:hypothetical protein